MKNITPEFQQKLNAIRKASEKFANAKIAYNKILFAANPHYGEEGGRAKFCSDLDFAEKKLIEAGGELDACFPGRNSAKEFLECDGD